MPEIICRMYPSRAKAEAALEALRPFGYADAQVFSADKAKGDTLDSVAAAISAASVVPEDARVYAERVMQGNTLVVVQALFGGALRARMLLDEHGPIESGVAETSQRLMTSVSDDSPAGGNWLGTLLRSEHPIAAITGWPLLTKEGWMFSDRFGWRYLTDDPTPLSSKLGWKLLSDEPHPLSSKFGWKLLSDEPHPLSSKLGWRLLSTDPAPQKAEPAKAEAPAIAAPAAKPEKPAKAETPPASPST